MRARIAAACRQVGRDPGGVELIAVSKYADVAAVRALAGAGQLRFGENRVQEALPKIEALRSEPAAAGGLTALEWHLIGHLQTNKARVAVEAFSMVESVDSLRIAEELSRRALRAGTAVPVLLQVNVDDDPAKHGLYTGHVEADYGVIAGLKGLRIEGLMTIGARVADRSAARPTFAALRELRARLYAQGVVPPLAHLSMGMSADFEVAIEEGATIVRVGKALFRSDLR